MVKRVGVMENGFSKKVTALLADLQSRKSVGSGKREPGTGRVKLIWGKEESGESCVVKGWTTIPILLKKQ